MVPSIPMSIGNPLVSWIGGRLPIIPLEDADFRSSTMTGLVRQTRTWGKIDRSAARVSAGWSQMTAKTYSCSWSLSENLSKPSSYYTTPRLTSPPKTIGTFRPIRHPGVTPTLTL